MPIIREVIAEHYGCDLFDVVYERALLDSFAVKHGDTAVLVEFGISED